MGDLLRRVAPHCSMAAAGEPGNSRTPSIAELAKRLEECNMGDLNYELFGLIEHRGDQMQGGHYVAYVNSAICLAREQWFGLSDAKVWKCDRAEVMKAEAYIAFYRRALDPVPVTGSAADTDAPAVAADSTGVTDTANP